MISREEYRLTLEHKYIGCEGKVIWTEEPKTYCYNIACEDTVDTISYRSYVIQELFLRFMKSVLREIEQICD